MVISGGGSALLCSPAEGITLEDTRNTIGSLLRSCTHTRTTAYHFLSHFLAVSIDNMNTIRKHIDSIKGGGLALAIDRTGTAVVC